MASADLPPFVIAVDPVEPERHGAVDLYLPAAAQPRPAVVFVHGGPIPSDRRPTPRDWPVYRGYGALTASGGAVAVTVDHRLHSLADYPRAADDVAAAVAVARADPRVDADRVALWFFSGGGPLLAPWLREPPAWLRCVAATYPAFGSGRTPEPRFQAAEAVTSAPSVEGAAGAAGGLPIVLTRVGRERAEIAATVEAFVAAARAAGARLEIIDVPHGQHGFDVLDHTDESREAVRRALDAVLAALA
jgi:acetyl esterase/lipase